MTAKKEGKELDLSAIEASIPKHTFTIIVKSSIFGENCLYANAVIMRSKQYLLIFSSSFRQVLLNPIRVSKFSDYSSSKSIFYI